MVHGWVRNEIIIIIAAILSTYKISTHYTKDVPLTLKIVSFF